MQIVVSFRFGREADESMGYNFVQTMYLEITKVFPPEKNIITTDLQVKGLDELKNVTFIATDLKKKNLKPDECYFISVR